ncbi:MAG TPA: META domain-containing protein [Devosia sp.]|nr:META domain-containing protein [Devosia sp.]
MRALKITILIGMVVAATPNLALAQADKPMGMAPAIIGTTWIATEINGAPAPTDRSTFKITEEMKAAGNGGCNSWFAAVALEGDTIQLGPIASTKKACLDTMQQEIDYFSALAASRTWEAAEGELRFLDAEGKVILRFGV